MIMKVPVQKLKIGAFLEKIDQSWLSTPFLSNRFEITSEKQIQKLKDSGITEVYIDTGKGLDVSVEEQSLATEESPRREYLGLSTDRLLVNTTLPFDLYIKESGGYTLYLRNGLPFHLEVHYKLESKRVNTVYIAQEDKGLLEKYEKDHEEDRRLSQQGLAPGFESQEKVRQYNDYLNNYMPVEPGVFIPGLKVPVNIYSEKETAVRLVLNAEAMVPENELFSNGTNGSARRNLLIHINDMERYKNFLKELASGKISDNSERASKARTAVIKENTKLAAKDLLDNPRSGEAIKGAKGAVSGIMETILENPTSFLGLMKINSYDYYTYIHSINVCTLSAGLGISLGLHKNELFSLSMGALMHDVGKSKVPSNLINKPGKLTDEEFVIVKKHVSWGEDLLGGNEDLSKKTLIPLLQHHEKLNGTGYPRKLEGGQIHPFGRISSIVDVYDALTTERSYKKAFKPFDAAAFLSKNKEEYDQEVFRHFVKMLGSQKN